MSLKTRRMVLGALLAGVLIVSGCGGKVRVRSSYEPSPGKPRPAPQSPAKQKPSSQKVQVGEASWYGRDFHGRRTASGEKYDMHALTAAHPSLPFGSIVRVRHVSNGKTVKVRINDRGPFKKGRIIDLSYAAANKIAMVQEGVAKVEVEIVQVGDGA